MGVNKVILLGNLGKDPEMRFTAQQLAICSFPLATGDRRKDASGKWVDHTEWHNVRVFGRTAENCANYLKKGRQVYIEGRIQTRKWQDKEGKDRYTTEIIANTVQFVGSRGDSAGMAPEMSIEETSSDDSKTSAGFDSLPSAEAVASSSAGAAEGASFDDDDIPF